MRISLKNYAAALAAGAGLLAACSGAQAANLIQNGGFEEPDVSAYVVINSGGSFTGWDVVGTGNVAPIQTDFPAFGSVLQAQAGSQWIDMTGVGSTAAGIQQSVTTLAGQIYRLTFWVGNVNSSGPNNTSTIKVRVNDAEILSATNADITPGQLNWKQFSTTFKAAGASTSVAFFNADSDDNNGLDSISLVAAGAPEPSTWAMMLLGFGGAGAIVRRRRAVQA